MFQPITGRTLRVGVLGAGRWAQRAHLPGWTRDSRCEVVALCDTAPDMLAESAAEFGVSDTTDNYLEVVSRGQACALRKAGRLRLP